MADLSDWLELRIFHDWLKRLNDGKCSKACRFIYCGRNK